MLSKNDIKKGQQWRKGVTRKGANLQPGNMPKQGKHTKHMTQDQLYDYLVKGF